jgi:hypothetical protein
MKLLITVLNCLLLGAFAFGQEKPAEKVDEKTADVAITARVTAKELKFEVVPNPKVEFFGKPERKTEWSSERKNLPESVQPGVTYRDIGITLKIVSVFADIDRIVDEALGIQPKTENAPATQKTVETPENKIEKPLQNPDTKKPETAKQPKNQ